MKFVSLIALNEPESSVKIVTHVRSICINSKSADTFVKCRELCEHPNLIKSERNLVSIKAAAGHSRASCMKIVKRSFRICLSDSESGERKSFLNAADIDVNDVIPERDVINDFLLD